MQRVLFVDDECRVLEGLRRMLHSLRNEWDMSFAASGTEALEIMAKGPVDVLLTDLRMAGMDGARLLAEVQSRHPETVRIVLSGQAEQELAMRSAAVAHQSLTKPCSAETLKGTVSRALALRNVVASPLLKQLISQLASLPAMPGLYVELMEAVKSPSTSLQQVGAVIQRDIAMTAKILQLVNSAFFGIGRHIASAGEAVTYLGVETISRLALCVQLFSQFRTSGLPRFSIEELWRHSMATATLSRRIAQSENAPKRLARECMTAGLLHDVGKLIFASRLPERYNEALTLAESRNIAQTEAEREIFGATHPEVGAYLLWLWGIPVDLIEATAFHHNPADGMAKTFTALTAVHVANALQYEVRATTSGLMAQIDQGYLARLGLVDGLPKWRALAQAGEGL